MAADELTTGQWPVDKDGKSEGKKNIVEFQSRTSTVEVLITCYIPRPAHTCGGYIFYASDRNVFMINLILTSFEFIVLGISLKCCCANITSHVVNIKHLNSIHNH